MGLISVKHSMPGGDLVSLLPSLKHLYDTTGNKSVIYQRVNLSYADFGGAYLGATYSIKDENKMPVSMNSAVFEALKPLLLYQSYIEDFKEWGTEEVDYDMDLLRSMETTMPMGNIQRYPGYVFPEMQCNLSEQSVFLPNKFNNEAFGKILINRTERYNNMFISYTFLKKYKDEVLFIGLPHEHEIFCKQNKLDIQHLYLGNFLEIAIALESCKVFIGNQSMCFQIAENLKIPRILEVCKQIPNVIGNGPYFYDFLYQKGLECWTDKLYNK
jgi:hypothetical protein